MATRRSILVDPVIVSQVTAGLVEHYLSARTELLGRMALPLHLGFFGYSLVMGLSLLAIDD